MVQHRRVDEHAGLRVELGMQGEEGPRRLTVCQAVRGRDSRSLAGRPPRPPARTLPVRRIGRLERPCDLACRIQHGPVRCPREPAFSATNSEDVSLAALRIARLGSSIVGQCP